MNKNEEYLNSAVYVCEHVSLLGAPVLRVRRDLPEVGDSGWQLLCGKAVENWESAKIWSLKEALNFDASLNELNKIEPGFIATRETRHDAWKIARL